MAQVSGTPIIFLKYCPVVVRQAFLIIIIFFIARENAGACRWPYGEINNGFIAVWTIVKPTKLDNNILDAPNKSGKDSKNKF